MMNSEKQEVILKNAEDLQCMTQWDNVVEVVRSESGQWIGKFVSGSHRHTVTLDDEFASFGQAVRKLSDVALRLNISTIYYKRK